MPCRRLTARQAQRLFALPADVCDWALTALVKRGALTCGSDGQFRLRERLDTPDLRAVLDCNVLPGPPGLAVD